MLPILWVFLTVNYLFCDIFSLCYSKFLTELLSGKVDGIEFTESFLLFFAIIMEIPMLMILISLIVKPKINKIINIFAGSLMIIIQIGSLTTGKNSLHYIFFSIVEISTLLLIIYTVWKQSKKHRYI